MDSLRERLHKAEQFISEGKEKEALKVLSEAIIQIWKQHGDGFLTSYQALELFESVQSILTTVRNVRVIDDLGQAYWMLWKVVEPLDGDLAEECRDAMECAGWSELRIETQRIYCDASDKPHTECIQIMTERAVIDPGAWLCVANEKRFNGDSEGAVDAALKVPGLHPCYIEAQELLAELNEEQGAYYDARDVYEYLEEVAPWTAWYQNAKKGLDIRISVHEATNWEMDAFDYDTERLLDQFVDKLCKGA